MSTFELISIGSTYFWMNEFNNISLNQSFQGIFNILTPESLSKNMIF